MNKPLGGAERPLFVSDSLLDQQLKLPSQAGTAPDQNLTRRAYAPGPQDQRLRVVEREIGPALSPRPIPMRWLAKPRKSTGILPHDAHRSARSARATPPTSMVFSRG